ncbi:MAG: cell division protein FtsZ [Erysipelotrichaceae bacterium]
MSVKYGTETKIKVFGLGGAGCNAVNHMVSEDMKGAEFFIANTDLQVLNASVVPNKLLLGKEITGGRGAGADPQVGKEAALESEDEIRELIAGADMVFITSGMGGGTGTGAAPVFARLAKEAGALTVAIVTKPFDFESPKRMRTALSGIEDLKEYVDSLIIVSNNKLAEQIGDIPLMDAFKEADNVLMQGIQTVTDLISVPALMNLDFADVRNVMTASGGALIGIGMSDGDNKAVEAAHRAINSPLLEVKIDGAKAAIINVTGGKSIKIQDAQAAADYIREQAGSDVEVNMGIAINEELGDAVVVTVIATGFEENVASYNPFESDTNNDNNVSDATADEGLAFIKNRYE